MKKWLIAAVLLLCAVVFVRVKVLPLLTVSVPKYQEPAEVVWLEQGWNETQRTVFYHTPQGTRLIPYSWFMALEQPCISLFACQPFHEQSYLGRFGFLSGKRDSNLNPDALPVGFALQKDFHDPDRGDTYPVVGLTCAACHTGQVEVGNVAYRLDGAPAMIEVAAFQKALGLAMIFTDFLPFRYARFEEKVLGPNARADDKAKLKAFFKSLLGALKAEKETSDKRHIYDNQAGFIRTDALTRIGNQVFAVDARIDDNFAVSNAPVRYPQIWDASWFDWVQYNASIADPLIRNIGESLGVRAAVKLYGPDAGKFENSVNIAGLRTIEELLAGEKPFHGLTSPKWPKQFPAFDRQKAAKGAELYKQHCEPCHLSAGDGLAADLAAGQPVNWWKNKQGKDFLTLKTMPIDAIGTDPHEAVDFANRTADTGALGKGRVSAAAGLDLVTKGIRGRFFETGKLDPAEQLAWGGYRDPAAKEVRDDLIYKARPLNGIWAAAPYLHNGSVPALYDLLSPQTERPQEFWLGSRKFDPVRVGYDTSKLQGGYLYDISKPGNSNSGHEFKDGPRGKGIIGPALKPEDRWALVEYLKTL